MEEDPLTKAIGKSLEGSRQLEQDTGGLWDHRNQCFRVVIDPSEPLEPLKERIRREMNNMAEFFDNDCSFKKQKD